MRVLLMTSHAGIGFNNAPPLGLYRLQYVLNTKNISCDIVDMSFDVLKETIKKASKGHYQIIGMSVSHYNMLEDISIILKFREACKGIECLFIGGGQEATYNYEQWLKVGLDVILLGYAEESIVKLAKSFEKGFMYGRELLNTIDGIAYKDNGETVFQPVQKMTQAKFQEYSYINLLKLNIPFETYWEQARRNAEALKFGTAIFIPEMVRLYTSSHCPNNCGFCSSHRFLSFSQQEKCPILMLNDDQIYNLTIMYINKYNAKGFLFSDDEFLLDKNRARSLCEKIIWAKNHGIMDKDILFNCQSRVSDFLMKKNNETKIHYEFISELRYAGFHSFGIGIETFHDRLLRSPSMNKRGFTGSDTQQILNALLEFGLVPQFNIILFIPESTRQEIEYTISKSLDFILKGCQVAVTPHLLSMPGAPIYGLEGYPVVREKYTNPQTGETIKIVKSLIPHDLEVRQCSDRIYDTFNNFLNDFKKSEDWNKKTVPKTILGILFFLSTAKLFGNNELVQKCKNTISYLIVKTQQGAI